MPKIQEVIASELELESLDLWKRTGGSSNNGTWAFKSSIGEIFAKSSDDIHRQDLLLGEFQSLKALEKAGDVKVPHPIKVISFEHSTILVTEYIHFNSLQKFQAELGKQLANLHLRNLKLLKENSEHAVQKFGFHSTVCCGKIPIDNEWNENWLDFYLKQRLAPQVNMIAKQKENKEVLKLWSSLESKIPQLFHDIQVLPSLLHGDLWSGNAGETDKEPVIFDPASFYGHHEFDLAITRMFGGFRQDFYEQYHQIIPKESGFEKRIPLYELFHYLNHWNHFGSSYEGQSLKLMKNLLKSLS